ncbi:nucleic-acid-binding protein from transposon X-element [Trichonephila clavipes]|nr:nucleic-acid-binding protein from transposon X-element [Trichonephila clavipes]
MPVSVSAAVPVAPKIPFIHLKFTDNYNLVMQAITRKWPKSSRPAHEVEIKIQTPHLFGGVKEAPGSPDIFQLETCCFLSVKIDSFNRRPGATQCYNCNLFHHSSSNCNIKTRCLKCGEPHKTGDCPIKTKIENPTCINCQQKGHLANSHRCPKFPKPKPKKGEASQNRNNKKVNTNSNIFSASSAVVQKEVSFANIVKNDKQMAPPLDQSEPAKSKPEATPNPPLKKIEIKIAKRMSSPKTSVLWTRY